MEAIALDTLGDILAEARRDREQSLKTLAGVVAGRAVLTGHTKDESIKILAENIAKFNPTMPKAPRGEKCPADAISLAVMIGKIATCEIHDEREATSSAAAKLGSLGGKKRAANMTPERRAEIAMAAAAKRATNPCPQRC